MCVDVCSSLHRSMGVGVCRSVDVGVCICV